MHIVIPMSGIGKRFIDGGYDVPKPLIEIDGKPIIQYVVELFPGETKFTFICNDLHFETTQMKETLLKIAPKSEIVSIESHTLGPVYTVSKIMDRLDDEEEIIVNYCDFGTYWDYEDFLSHTRNRNADGAIVSYKGFHPHMLGVTKYATIRENKQWMLEIKEKGSFTDDRLQEFVSNGTYYFKKGRYIKKYFKEMMDKDINLNGEFYVSLIYNLLVRDNLKVSVYDIQHMLQWGEPYDFGSYRNYSNYFKSTIKKQPDWNAQSNSITVIPLVDKKMQFIKEGYNVPNYLLPLSGLPMVIQANKQLPASEKDVYICSKKFNNEYGIEKTLKTEGSNITFKYISDNVNGSASACHLALEDADDNNPVLIGSIETSVHWNHNAYNSLISDDTIDVIIWTTKDYPAAVAKPNLFKWLDMEGGSVNGFSINESQSDQVKKDHMVIDIFYFKSASLFNSGYKEIVEKNIQVGNEYCIESVIESLIMDGKKINVFQVDSYINWGATPGEYETFKYWQSFFHKFDDHIYDIENDALIEKNSIPELKGSFTSFKQSFV